MPETKLPGVNMIDPHSVADQPSETPPHGKRGRSKFFFAILLLLMGLLLIAGGNLMQRQMRDLDEEVSNDRARIKALEEHVRDMQERPEKTPAASSASPQPLGAENTTPDIARSQSDLAAMSSALSALQSEVKATGAVASQTKETAQSSVATLLAFVELREAVLSGRKFGPELTAMKTAAKDNSGIKDALARLDAYADTGVTTPAALSDQLIPLETLALQAVDKADAQDWEDRFMAELKGLISIRPLHGGAGTGFTAMENSLAVGDTAAALTALNNLPSDAQHVLEDWRVRAQARTAAEQALHDVSLLISAPGAP